MNLPFLKKSNLPEKREYLFALEIGHETIKSAIWSVVNQKTQVLSIGTSVTWDESQPDQLVPAVDKSLSDATTHFDGSGKSKLEKMILGLPPDWVTDDKIAVEKLHQLKELAHKLSLSAVGFVVTTQALVRHLHHVEGVPPTAILIGFGALNLEVTLVRLGKIEATHLVKRSSNPQSDIVEGLYRFGKVDMLPSRILIYDSTSDLEDIKQQLLSYPWQAPQTRLPFLHFPKIEVLPSDFSVKAISLSGGSEVAQAIGLIPSAQKEVPSSPKGEVVPTVATPQDLGFSPESDIPPSVLPVVGSSVAEEAKVSPEVPSARRQFSPPKISFPKFNFKFSLPRVNLLPWIIIVLVLAAGGLFAAYWYLPTAAVTVTVASQALDQEFAVTASIAATEVDPTSHTLPARVVEATVSDELEKPTSGTKLVGDKATGEITVINGTSTPRTFPAGTVISSPADLKFTFDSAVEVASASGTADPNSYSPGKANVKITAASIGSDSNFSAGTQFKIGSFSSLDFVARNEAAFSGGSSRQVAAVSKDDLTGLRSALLDTLKTQITDKLTAGLGADDLLVDTSTVFQVTTETYDHKADDTADKVKLSLGLKASAIAMNNSDLAQLAMAEITPKIPSGFKLAGDPNYNFSVGSTSDGATGITIKTSSSLVPEIDKAQAVKSLVGKTPKEAKDYFGNLPQIQEVSFSFSPHFPSFMLTLPHVAKNITISVRSGQ